MKKKKKVLNKLFKRYKRGRGGIFIVLIMGIVMTAGVIMVGGVLPQLPEPDANSIIVVPEVGQNTGTKTNSLALRDFKFKPVTPSPAQNPTQTQISTAPQSCYDNTAIAMLVDVSGSMNDKAVAGNAESKMTVLKRALSSFTGYFTTQTLAGLFAYSTNTGVLVPFGQYSQNQTALTQQINALTAGQFGQATNTRQGLQLAYNNLVTLKQQFPQRRVSLVFFTDGVPENTQCTFMDSQEVYRTNNNLNGTICARNFNDHPEHPGTISSQIKSLGVRIYTVALYKQPPYSTRTQAEIENIMSNVASNPNSQYYIGLPTGATLEQAYNTIAQRICTSN